ncbi:uncharacterized protein LOC141910689 [Tubulanus polymorphus]|uniref:uncharacterized protein LOC141910689 n=1 Tax=Tubulanus polymorphus TaxID=672921 RepID=UPI003DA23658
MPNHSKEGVVVDLCHRLLTFRSLNAFCDLELYTPGSSRRVHAAVFAAHSNAFYKMAAEAGTESVTRFAIDDEESDITESMFDSLLEFFYTGSTDGWDPSTCRVFARLAVVLESDSLARACRAVPSGAEFRSISPEAESQSDSLCHDSSASVSQTDRQHPRKGSLTPASQPNSVPSSAPVSRTVSVPRDSPSAMSPTDPQTSFVQHGSALASASRTDSVQHGSSHGSSPAAASRTDSVQHGSSHGSSLIPASRTDSVQHGSSHGSSLVPASRTDSVQHGSSHGSSPAAASRTDSVQHGSSHGSSPAPASRTDSVQHGSSHGSSPAPASRTDPVQHCSSHGSSHGSSLAPTSVSPRRVVRITSYEQLMSVLKKSRSTQIASQVRKTPVTGGGTDKKVSAAPILYDELTSKSTAPNSSRVLMIRSPTQVQTKLVPFKSADSKSGGKDVEIVEAGIEIGHSSSTVDKESPFEEAPDVTDVNDVENVDRSTADVDVDCAEMEDVDPGKDADLAQDVNHAEDVEDVDRVRDVEVLENVDAFPSVEEDVEDDGDNETIHDEMAKGITKEAERLLSGPTSKTKSEPECALCSEGFIDKNYLWLHLKSKHGNVELKCSQCDLALNDREQFVNHDDRCIRSNSDIAASRSRVSGGAASINACYWCGRYFASCADLWAHHRSAHEGKDLQCNHCLMVFTTEQKLIVHGIRSECVKKATAPPSGDDLNYKCPDCYFRTDERAKMLIHWRMLHVTGQAYVCDVCDGSAKVAVRMIRLEEYAEHLLTLHDRFETGGIFAFLSHYSCECAGDFRTFDVVKAEQHARKCGMAVWRVDGLTPQRREREDFGGVPLTFTDGQPKTRKKFECDVCAKTFETSYEREFHRFKRHDRTPTGDEVIRCDKCAFATNRDAHMKTHRRKEHPQSPDRLFCQMCKLHFDEKPAYLRHLQVHGIFKCDVCPYLTERGSALVRHMKNNHAESDWKVSDHPGVVVGPGARTERVWYVKEDMNESADSTRSMTETPTPPPPPPQPMAKVAKISANKKPRTLTIKIPTATVATAAGDLAKHNAEEEKLIEAAAEADEKRMEYVLRYIPVRTHVPNPSAANPSARNTSARNRSAAVADTQRPNPSAFTSSSTEPSASTTTVDLSSTLSPMKKRSRHSKNKSKTPMKRSKYSCHLCVYTCDKQEALFKHFERCQKNKKP